MKIEIIDIFIIVAIIIFVIINLLYFTGIIPQGDFIITFNNNLTQNDSTSYVPIIYIPMTP